MEVIGIKPIAFAEKLARDHPTCIRDAVACYEFCQEEGIKHSRGWFIKAIEADGDWQWPTGFQTVAQIDEEEAREARMLARGEQARKDMEAALAYRPTPEVQRNNFKKMREALGISEPNDAPTPEDKLAEMRRAFMEEKKAIAEKAKRGNEPYKPKNGGIICS